VLGPVAVAANRVAFERAAALGARLCPPVSASPAYNVAVKDNRRHGKPVPPPVSERVNENGRNKSDPVREVPKPEPGHPVLGRWAGRLTQYGPGDYRTRFRVNLMLRSVTVGATGGVTKVPHQCSSALQVEKSTDRIAVYRETVTRGKGCYRSTVRTRVERQGERLTVRSTATTKEGRAVQLGILSRSR
jgi:hypothetical protein